MSKEQRIATELQNINKIMDSFFNDIREFSESTIKETKQQRDIIEKQFIKETTQHSQLLEEFNKNVNEMIGNTINLTSTLDTILNKENE